MDLMDILKEADDSLVKTANSKTDEPYEPFSVTFKNWEDFRHKVGQLHGKTISRGIRMQRVISNRIKASGNHLEVQHDCELPVPPGFQKNDHKMDIFIINEKSIDVYDCKSKAPNNTQDAQNVLEEYQLYIRILEKQYPNKKIKYSILKEGWNDPKKSRDPRYKYMHPRGIRVYDLFDFMRDKYGVSEEEIVKDLNHIVFNEAREIGKN